MPPSDRPEPTPGLPPYRVLTSATVQLEDTITHAYHEGWAVVAVYVARFVYGLGGEYTAREVTVILQRRIPDAPPVPHAAGIAPPPGKPTGPLL